MDTLPRSTTRMIGVGVVVFLVGVMVCLPVLSRLLSRSDRVVDLQGRTYQKNR